MGIRINNRKMSNESDSELVVITSNELARPATLPLDRNPCLIYIASLQSPASKRTMLHALSVAASIFAQRDIQPEVFPWWQLRYQHVEALRAQLAERFSPAMANKTLCAVRQVLYRCRRLGMIDHDVYDDASHVKGIKGSRLPKGRALSAEEIDLLRAACGQDTIGLRDSTVLEILINTGMRRFEVASIEMQHVDLVAKNITVLGKGNKQRAVPINTPLYNALFHWISACGDPERGFLLHPVVKGGRILLDRPMSASSIFALLEKLIERASTKSATPHDFRRTFISTLLDKGVDISTASKLAGHSSVETTRIYDRRDERAMVDAVNLLAGATK